MRIETALIYFFERHNGARRRRQLRGPGFRVTVEPRCLHARLRRAHDIKMRVITDVQHLSRLDAGCIESMSEYADVRLGGAGGNRSDVAFEPMRDAAAL